MCVQRSKQHVHGWSDRAHERHLRDTNCMVSQLFDDARKVLACEASAIFFFSSRRRHTRFDCDWSSDVCSSDLTTNLLAFARAGSKERTLVDLNEIVRRTFALRSYHLTTLNITVNLELDESNPKAWANGSEMQQMLLNLLINGEQALTGVTRRRALTERPATAGEGHGRLHMAATGSGIPPDIEEKIFDPFFTPKP